MSFNTWGLSNKLKLVWSGILEIKSVHRFSGSQGSKKIRKSLSGFQNALLTVWHLEATKM